jgi:type IV secretion system protein VirB10
VTETSSGAGLADPVRTEKEIAAELRLRPEPAKVVRLSRKVLGVIAGVSALALGGSLIWALQTKAPRTVDELYNTDSRATAEGLSRLPSDYAGAPRDVPQLGPPLPGDLGGPMLEAGVVPDTPIGASGPTAGATSIDPEAQRMEQERQRLAQEIDAARASRLFATEARADGQPASTTAAAIPVGLATPGLPGTPEVRASDQPGSGPASTRRSFLDRETGRDTQSSARLQTPSSPYVVQAGSVIAAALLTGLRSDLPGQITAQVTESVYDSPTGRHLLIPQGSRLIGEYDAEVSFGQSRALLVWTRLILPDGRSIVLDREPGADPAGRAGLEDQVDNHWGQLFRAAMLSTLLSVGAEAGSSSDEEDLLQTIRRGASDGINQTGRQVVGRSLDVRPTITVRPGFAVRVIVTRDLILERD